MVTCASDEQVHHTHRRAVPKETGQRIPSTQRHLSRTRTQLATSHDSCQSQGLPSTATSSVNSLTLSADTKETTATASTPKASRELHVQSRG
jgi:hypothetical protein